MHHGMALLLHLCISAAARMSKAPAQLTRMSSYTNVQLHRHATTTTITTQASSLRHTSSALSCTPPHQLAADIYKLSVCVCAYIYIHIYMARWRVSGPAGIGSVGCGVGEGITHGL